MGDARSDGAGGQTTRLEKDDLPVARKTGIENRRRHARGFPGPWRCPENEVGLRAELRGDFSENAIDGQRGKAHREPEDSEVGFKKERALGAGGGPS
jgi:hypothetical protein